MVQRCSILGDELPLVGRRRCGCNMVEIVIKRRVAVVLLLTAMGLAGCASRDYDSVRSVAKTEVAEHQFRTPAGFKPIAGDSYPIPLASGKPRVVDTKNGGSGRLPARTTDGQRISILPPGAKI